MPKFFKKALLNQPFVASSGKVSFEPVGNNEGVRQLDETTEAALIAELDAAADRRRGGIIRISQEIFASLKKNSPTLKPSRSQRGVLQQIRLHNPESLVPKSSGPPMSAVESAGGVLPKRSSAEPTVAELKKQVDRLQKQVEAKNGAPEEFSLHTAKRSEVEAKVAEANKEGAK